MTQGIQASIDDIYRTESRRILATLIRLLGDFDLAEDALQEAFRVAVEKWPQEGLPNNPRTWLISTGRFKAIDVLRRRGKFDVPLDDQIERLDIADPQAPVGAALDEAETHEGLDDDRLRLIFTCCHPALPPDARVALTLREVCGLSTEAIASAFLTSPSTLAQRIVRAKNKIRAAGIPYKVPAREQLAERLSTVLQVVYLVFNEGHMASAGDTLTRPDLSGEAIRLGRLLMQLLPEPEVIGLLALMLLHESRRSARVDVTGDLVLLEDQDRHQWQRDLIDEGVALVNRAWDAPPIGNYVLQAAIAATHAIAPTFAQTDWTQIVYLYDALLRVAPSPVVQLNRAAAIAMRDGAAVGLALIDAILARGEMADYVFAHAARADLCRRLGRVADARAAYQRALALAQQEPERRFLERQLGRLQGDPSADR